VLQNASESSGSGSTPIIYKIDSVEDPHKEEDFYSKFIGHPNITSNSPGINFMIGGGGSQNMSILGSQIGSQ
jgi:hypothetical protein